MTLKIPLLFLCHERVLIPFSSPFHPGAFYLQRGHVGKKATSVGNRTRLQVLFSVTIIEPA